MSDILNIIAEYTKERIAYAKQNMSLDQIKELALSSDWLSI